MASLTIKLPEDQKTEIESVAQRKNYNSTSEYVREALRDKVEEDLRLKPEVAEELRKRVRRAESGQSESYTLDELETELGLQQ